MTPTEYKELVQASWRTAIPDLIEEYLVDLKSDKATLEDKRKAVEMGMRVTGAEVDKKVDPNAGLATFNFTFSNGGVTVMPVAELVRPDDVEDATPREIHTLEMAPARAESAPLRPEPSMEDMMAGLDEMLGDAA